MLFLCTEVHKEINTFGARIPRSEQGKVTPFFPIKKRLKHFVLVSFFNNILKVKSYLNLYQKCLFHNPFHLSGIKVLDAGDTFQRRGLSRAVMADKPVDIAGTDVQADVGDAFAAAFIMFCEILDCKHGFLPVDRCFILILK